MEDLHNPVLPARMPMIQTPRLVLHAFADADLEDALELLYNDEIKKTFMLPDFASRADAVEMFRVLQRMSHSEEHFVYGVYCKERLIGFLNDVELDGDSVELGYVVHPNWKNQGYATETLTAAIPELFRIGYTSVKAGFFEENQASRRVLEKSGMKKTEFTAEIEYRGTTHHCIYYAINKP